jgi:hypothetical protein
MRQNSPAAVSQIAFHQAKARLSEVPFTIDELLALRDEGRRY